MPDSIREFHVLNLGAGVQSTALYLMSMEGLVPRIDCAIFADTQEEPKAVYDHLKWLNGLGGPTIYVRTAGKLGDDLMRDRNTTGGRFASIPAFTTDGNGSTGITRRQCSKEYKVEVIQRFVRREVVGLLPRRTIPKSVIVHQYIGISLDEQARAKRIAAMHDRRSLKCHFPLIEKLWTRRECLDFLSTRVPHQTPRSACVFCPYNSDLEWAHIKANDPEGWSRAVEIDEGLRTPGNIVNRDMRQTMYLHRSRQPLALVQLDPKPVKYKAIQLEMSFNGDCQGVCGV